VSGHVTFAVFAAAFAAARLALRHRVVFVRRHVALTIFAAAFATAGLSVGHLAVLAHRTLIARATRTRARFVARRRSGRRCRCCRLRHHRQRKQHRDYNYHQLRFHDFLIVESTRFTSYRWFLTSPLLENASYQGTT
jgi:hypothetical protein